MRPDLVLKNQTQTEKALKVILLTELQRKVMAVLWLTDDCLMTV